MSSRQTLITPRKRACEDDISRFLPATKHPWLNPESSLPTPSFTTSSSDPRKQLKTHCPQQFLGEHSSNWFLNRWLQSICQSSSIQEQSEGSDTLPTIEAPVQAASDQMSRQEDTLSRNASSKSDRLTASSSKFRGILRRNGSVIDNLGAKIPPEVKELIDKHIRKERESPPLDNDDKAKIRETMKDVWDHSEAVVSDILKTPLFPPKPPDIDEERDIKWSTAPLPHNDYPYRLPAPKTDRHFGFQTRQKSDWTDQQLDVADHPMVMPYSQPTRGNLFPLYIVEVKSEATNGTIYEGEGQVALGGLHRVRSMLWLLNQVHPSRTPSTTDAVVFSLVVSQREAVAHVHYYNPEDRLHYMSYIDTFVFLKDAQGCRDYHQNVFEWMVEVQQPIIQDILTRLHPIVMTCEQGRPASIIAERAASFVSEAGRPTKRQRT